MQKGFTAIEVLVVIIIVGILVSIGVVSYSGYQKRAYDASVQSDLDSIAGELESYRTRQSTDNPDQQFPRTKANLDTLQIQAAKGAYDTTISYNMIYCITNSGTDAYQAYTLVAKSKSGKIYMMTQDGFKANSLTQSNLTATLCDDLGMGLVSNGMYAANTWQSWVRTSI
jgi:type IV pilus assembly protein PilE